MVALPREIPVAPLPPSRLKQVLTAEQAEELDLTIARAREALGGRVVWNVNSTARGGGVAEMLQSLIAYTRGAGVDARWVAIEGTPAFFAVTKRIHNQLHGSPGDGAGLHQVDRETYEQATEANRRRLAKIIRPVDVVLLHDPQTAGLVPGLKAAGAKVVWRCHVGTDVPHRLADEAWAFLRPYLRGADRYVFSRAAFARPELDSARTVIIPPSIDAFSPKNAAMTPPSVHAVLQAAGIQPGNGAAASVFVREDGTPGRVDRRAEILGGGPLPPDAQAVIQVSRWDRLKDPAGVLEAFCDGIAPRTAAHLVLAGPAPASVTDDPEGLAVLAELEARWRECPEAARSRIHLVTLPMDDPEENAAIVNALQRRADVVVQKSLAEGFGLTVAEGMWKARPVVASAVGGIRDQIVHGESGLLVQPADLAGFADAVIRVLDDPAEAARLGANAQLRVRDLFLGPRHLRQFVDLFEGALRDR